MTYDAKYNRITLPINSPRTERCPECGRYNGSHVVTCSRVTIESLAALVNSMEQGRNDAWEYRSRSWKDLQVLEGRVAILRHECNKLRKKAHRPLLYWVGFTAMSRGGGDWVIVVDGNQVSVGKKLFHSVDAAKWWCEKQEAKRTPTGWRQDGDGHSITWPSGRKSRIEWDWAGQFWRFEDGKYATSLQSVMQRAGEAERSRAV